MADFWLKTGDTKPSITATLTDATGAPVDLTGAESVTFVMKLIDEEDPIITGEADVIDGPTASVQYDWQEGDTDVPGGYRAEWVVVFNDGGDATFPNDGYDYVAILERQEVLSS